MKKNNNFRVLFTSVGRRVELIQAFHKAAKELCIKLKIFGADLSGTAPALFYCDEQRQICPIHNAEYIPALLDICRKDGIDLVIPTLDTDLLLLSQARGQFEEIGTRVMISAPDMIAICRDKYLTADFFVGCGLKTPKPVDSVTKYCGGYPCFIKPRDGSSSINAYKVDKAEELHAIAGRVSDYIIQPFITGREYTVDIFCDFEGNPIYITPRERLAVRGGEVLKSQICLDSRMIDEAKQLIERLKPCGQITVQLIRMDSTGEDYFIEINPRFGGGAPLSMKAGADSAKATLRLLAGEKIGFANEKISDGLIYTRFDQSICTNEPIKKVKAVVFDLDDTLYSEKEYIRSGFHAVAELLPEVLDAEQQLWTAFEADRLAIDYILTANNLKERRPECLPVYRCQRPAISLYNGVQALLTDLKVKGIKTAILTDGRPEGQRAKLEALGLNGLVDEIIVTDELGGVEFRKPCDIGFRILSVKLGVHTDEMLYIGDNPQKDFIAPKSLGMQCLYFRNTDGLYSHDVISDIRTVNSTDEMRAAVQQLLKG